MTVQANKKDKSTLTITVDTSEFEQAIDRCIAKVKELYELTERTVHIQTPSEFAEEMKRLAKQYHDIEGMHISMDECMCKLLKALGYSEGVAIFERSPLWYA